ncbi:hypothetical protein ACLOJK_041424, partial [Asimina triloba]
DASWFGGACSDESGLHADGSGFMTWGKNALGTILGMRRWTVKILAEDGVAALAELFCSFAGSVRLKLTETTSAVDFNLGTLATDRTGLDVGHADLKLDGWVSRIVC